MNKKIITLTSLAIKQLKNITKHEKAKGILFSVKSGGCNGFEYKFESVNSFENDKNIITEDGLTVEVCNKSIFHLLGTNIDWKEDIMGRGFVFDNPMAQASCGLGAALAGMAVNALLKSTDNKITCQTLHKSIIFGHGQMNIQQCGQRMGNHCYILVHLEQKKIYG